MLDVRQKYGMKNRKVGCKLEDADLKKYEKGSRKRISWPFERFDSALGKMAS